MYYNERIAWIRDCRSITQKEMAEKLGIIQDKIKGKLKSHSQVL